MLGGDGNAAGKNWLEAQRESVECIANALRGVLVKSATIPSIRVEPELRRQAEDVLAEGESLSEFVEASVRDSIRRRRTQAEFIARGIASLDEAKKDGVYVQSGVVLEKLETMLVEAKAKAARKRATRS
jgi:hypothetical protein